MSKKKSKRKIQVSNSTAQPPKTVSKLEQSAKSTISTADNQTSNDSGLVFGRKNFLFLLGGIGLIALGYVLMAGGSMDSPDMWDEDRIYGARRTLIAPIFILAGLGLQVYTIFSKK